MTCTCPDINPGGPPADPGIAGVNWDPSCEDHGVGTAWFRALTIKPLGYGAEARTSRRDWLKYMEKRTKGWMHGRHRPGTESDPDSRPGENHRPAGDAGTASAR